MKARAQSAKRRQSKTAAASQPKPDEGHWSQALLEPAVEGAIDLTVRAVVKSVIN